MKKVKLIIAGAGSRGMGYARFAEACPDRLEIVGVAKNIKSLRRTYLQTGKT
jgi:hypothetical protein